MLSLVIPVMIIAALVVTSICLLLTIWLRWLGGFGGRGGSGGFGGRGGRAGVPAAQLGPRPGVPGLPGLPPRIEFRSRHRLLHLGRGPSRWKTIGIRSIFGPFSLRPRLVSERNSTFLGGLCVPGNSWSCWPGRGQVGHLSLSSSQLASGRSSLASGGVAPPKQATSPLRWHFGGASVALGEQKATGSYKTHCASARHRNEKIYADSRSKRRSLETYKTSSLTCRVQVDYDPRELTRAR